MKILFIALFASLAVVSYASVIPLGWGGLGWGGWGVGHGAAVIGPAAPGPVVVAGPSGKIITTGAWGLGHGHWWG
ncbi:hypothetical protein HHI36_010111 [Cryptolaemus montrouzieri]|uniref:Uncharacterized protein n=1 Tax=Cryptolaemus montrouzieri TaxID=559131 RepID=A0ABD2MHY5_9CUCU